MIAHARPSSELWRFISDSIFDISIFDIQESGLAGGEGGGVSRSAKHQDTDDSMFEIKVLVESSAQANLLHRDMRLINFADSELRELGVSVREDSRRAELVGQTDASPRQTGDEQFSNVSPYYCMCPHTTVCVSSYYCMCVLILHVSSYCYVCVLILLCMCPPTI